MKQRINLGIVQMESRTGDVEYNTAKATAFIGKAAGMGAHFVCLPELFATGYNMEILRRGIVDLSGKYYRYIRRKISETARRNKVHVIAPFGEKRHESGPVYNSVLVFDDEGRVIGSYAKTHLWNLEKLYFAEGFGYPVFETKYCRIGILVCYDLEFPEGGRLLAKQGAEILFAPSAWSAEYETDWDFRLLQLACENRLFTAGVNRAGSEGSLRFLGKSKVLGPEGNRITELPKGEEKIGVCSIEIPVAGIPFEMNAKALPYGLKPSLSSAIETEAGPAVAETDIV